MEITHTVGAVLAGGSSTRMGRSKASLLLEGVSFLERVHGTLSSVFADVTVFGGSVVPPDGILIQDEEPGEGPVGGLLTAMHMARGRPVFIASVDTPLLTDAAIRALVEPPVPDDGVRVAFASSRLHPLTAVYGSGLEPMIKAHFDEGRRSVLEFIDSVERVVEVEVDADAVFNVNTEEDYQRLVERYGL